MAHRIREADRALTDQEVHSVLVAVEEGRDADNHLEDEDAERPPIDREVVTVSNEHLWRQVLCSAAERVCELTLLDELCEAEIRHKQVAIFANEHILRLQITINNALLMQMRKCESNLSCEELSLVLREHSHLNEMAEELTTLDKLHEEVDTVLVLEDILHVDEEGVVDLTQDVFLELDVFHLLVLQNDILPDDLHGVELAGLRMLDEEDLAEGTLADKLTDLEIAERGLLALVASEDGSCAASH
mmetsp:Transcript_46424/g.61484  ORF Transcript_46424/g.61484 Transcript_46424/m.61484 type:complete len:245 (+) Transcript_46424:821-1555(+)